MILSPAARQGRQNSAYSPPEPGTWSVGAWNDGGIGRYLTARHGASPTLRNGTTLPPGTPVKVSINLVFQDGHAEGVRPRKMWELTWHKDWQQTQKPPY